MWFRVLFIYHFKKLTMSESVFILSILDCDGNGKFMIVISLSLIDLEDHKLILLLHYVVYFSFIFIFFEFGQSEFQLQRSPSANGIITDLCVVVMWRLCKNAYTSHNRPKFKSIYHNCNHTPHPSTLCEYECWFFCRLSDGFFELLHYENIEHKNR